jgi:hypothetical protein
MYVNDSARAKLARDADIIAGEVLPYQGTLER